MLVVCVHEEIKLMVIRIPLVACVCLSAFNIPSLAAGGPELLPQTQDYYHHFQNVPDNLEGKTQINGIQVTISNDKGSILSAIA